MVTRRNEWDSNTEATPPTTTTSTLTEPQEIGQRPAPNFPTLGRAQIRTLFRYCCCCVPLSFCRGGARCRWIVDTIIVVVC